MPISPMTEELLPFVAAARRLPSLRAGRPVAPSTLWRWASVGVRGVRLETVCVGGVRCTSVEALQRFIRELSGLPQVERPSRGEAAHQAAVERQLASCGVH
jgi:hypothetical protein